VHARINYEKGLLHTVHSTLIYADVCTGRQAVLVMACENMHMSDDLVLDPGIVMIFAHGVE